VNQGNALDALTQLFGYKFTGFSAGFNLQIPLGNRAAKADYGRLATEKQTTENRIKATQQQIILEVRNAINQIEMNKARIEAAQASRALAEKQLEAEQKKFDLGASTLRFVLEEQRNLTQMQTNEIATLVNYSKALVDYERALGTTLGKYNIEIQKTLSASK
jgi:outer membrane protein TolC